MTISLERRTLAVEAGQQGMEQVLANNATWKDRALSAIRALPFATDGTFEEFRFKIVGSVGEPGHHNAWGALAGAAIKGGWLQDTGRQEHMTSRKSHGRMSAVLFRTSKV